MIPKIISGKIHNDDRGSLKYNNNFDLSPIKRMYLIENDNALIKRGWQGHKIEQRWFTATSGHFLIQLLKIDHWENPSNNLKSILFELSSATFDVLHIPSGYVTYIESQALDSKLLVMSDYKLGEIEDDFKYTLDKFEVTKNRKLK